MKVLTSRTKVKYTDPGTAITGLIRTGSVCIDDTPTSPEFGRVCILQDATVLSGDGTRAQRIAAWEAKLAGCVEIADGEIVLVNGEQRRLRYKGNYADSFELELIKE